MRGTAWGPELWSKLRADYESGRDMAELLDHYGVKRTTVYQRASLEAWDKSQRGGRPRQSKMAEPRHPTVVIRDLTVQEWIDEMRGVS